MTRVFPTTINPFYLPQGFTGELFPDLFSWSTFVSGLVAIAAEFTINLLNDLRGVKTPIYFAVLFSFVGAVIVYVTWTSDAKVGH